MSLYSIDVRPFSLEISIMKVTSLSLDLGSTLVECCADTLTLPSYCYCY